MGLRRLLWLIALVAFAWPPAIAAAATTANAAPSMIPHHCADCPPPIHPENGDARHAAGICCPLMAQAVAVLSSMVVIASSDDADVFPIFAGRHLSGLSPHQDPPPPRV